MKSQALAIGKLGILGIATLVFLVGCGGGTSQPFNNQSQLPSGSNPTPAITTISPNSNVAGAAAFTLTINGTNFVSASMVNFGGTTVATTFVSSAQLTAAIPASSIVMVGTATVIVSNPPPGGGASNTMNFAINSEAILPTISFLDPTCAPVGAQAFTLAVFGSNFLPSSVVKWNGNDRPTTFISSSQLTAQIPGSDTAVTGMAGITVFNPPPGGGTSNSSALTISTGGVNPQSVAVDPSGKFAYVADAGCAGSSVLSMYTISASTGVLTSIGSLLTRDQDVPYSLAVHPSGKFVYLGNSGSRDDVGQVSMYSLNATTGALTSIGYVNAFIDPLSLAVHPSGKFAYVTNGYTSQFGKFASVIDIYTIDATTGVLSGVGETTAGLSTSIPTSIAIDPSGKVAYVANSGSDSVSMYTINAITGDLTFLGSIAAQSSPNSIAIHPSGKFAYVANSGSNDVSMYSIDGASGTLTSLGPIAAGTKPSSLAVDPTGEFAYVANSGSNDVSMYSIDNTRGTLTFLGSIAAQSSPNSIAIHPSGKFAYVTNSGSNDVSMFSIDAATGALTLIGTIGT